MGVRRVERELVISEIPAECPGLVGPTELSAWQMKLDFEARTFSSAGRTAPIIYARSVHPCMSLLEYTKEPLATVYQAGVPSGSDEDRESSEVSSDEDCGLSADGKDSAS